MTFYTFGLNYESAALAATEAFSLDAAATRALYETLDLGGEAEVVFFSTCNRTEVYLYGTEADVRRVQEAVSAQVGQSWPEDSSFLRSDEAAVRHMLQVASGLRSMVLGDGQVFGQMKEAYRRAVDHGGVHSVMHRLMHAAFRAAKKVARETALGRGAASVSTAALALARDHFAERDACDALEDRRVLLVGTGTMGRLALNALDSEKPAALRVSNRSSEEARTVAAEHDAETVPWDDRHAAAGTSDFVLVATGASTPVLTAPRLSSSVELAGPTLFVDISMPRNVDPDVAHLDDYTLYDLNDVRAWTQRVQDDRRAEVPHAKALCEDELQQFVTWVFHQEAMQPAIEALRNTFDAIREQEVERHAHRTDMDRAEVDRLTKSIMQKLLAVPIVKLKNVDPDSIDFVQGIELLHALFSRPSCEDDSARDLQERPDSHVPSLSNFPDGLSVGSSEASGNEDEPLIREALRRAEDSSPS